MRSELSGAVDRGKVTNRNTTIILSAVYKSVGIDLFILDLSYSTIYRGSIKFRYHRRFEK